MENPAPAEGEPPFSAPEALFRVFNEDLERFAGPEALAEAAEHRRSDRVEQRLPSGARLIRFANGTTKLVLPDGTADVRFDNGDLKRVSGGVTVYYYSDVGTLFT